MLSNFLPQPLQTRSREHYGPKASGSLNTCLST